MKDLSPRQQAELKSLAACKHNLMDGAQIAEDLLANADAWVAFVVVTCEPYVTLRDVDGEGYYKNTLLLRVPADKEDGFLALASLWSPDEVGILRQNSTQGEAERYRFGVWPWVTSFRDQV